MTSDRQFYAHSMEGQPPSEWQPLEQHLRNVANLAAEFAAPFGGEEWARELGACHDLGKGTLPWQAYLRQANDIVDEFARSYEGHPTHALLGAQHLFKYPHEAGKLCAYCIAGHHAGLPNWHDHSESALDARMSQVYPKTAVPVPSSELPTEHPLTVTDRDMFGFQLQFFVRMLFSGLVDADYLDTEGSMDKNRSDWRSEYPSLEVLRTRFWRKFNQLRKDADPKAGVNQQREVVLQDCLKKAAVDSGLFSLTATTP